MRKFRNIITIIIVIVATFLVLKKFHALPSAPNMFGTKPVLIDATPILIKNIKSIGQLILYTAYDEVVADSIIVTHGSAFVNAFNHLSPLPIPSADKQLVLIGKGKVLAGTDFSMIEDSSLTIHNDTVTLVLPKAKIIDAIVNPSDFEVFIEKGQWSSEELALVKLQARRKLEARALQQNILDKADVKAKTVLQTFLESMKFKKVIIY